MQKKLVSLFQSRFDCLIRTIQATINIPFLEDLFLEFSNLEEQYFERMKKLTSKAETKMEKAKAISQGAEGEVHFC